MNENLPLALQIGASEFHPAMDLDDILRELSPYENYYQIQEMFEVALEGNKSVGAELTLWAVRSALIITEMPSTTRDQLICLIGRLGTTVDAHQAAA